MLEPEVPLVNVEGVGRHALDWLSGAGWAAPRGSVVNPPANAGGAGSTPWKEPLEKEMATQFGTLTWKIPWTEEPGVAEESDTT